MSFQEQPDHFGRVFVTALGVWSGLAIVVWFGLAHALPDAMRDAAASARASRLADDAQDRAIVAIPSACRAAVDDPRSIVRAYLDGAELDATPRAPQPIVDAELRARGTELFTRDCAGCHGATGQGNGPKARPLWATHPAVLQAGVYELRTTEHEALPTDEDIFRTITRGVHGTAMPPWILLPERDRWALVAHVKSLSKQFADDEAPPPIARGPAPDATPERIAHGRALFTSGGCASCHGSSGHGDGAAAASLQIPPRDLTSARFHRGSSTVDIHTTLVTGLDGTPMGSFAKVMAADDLWDVALYVHALAPAYVERAGMRCPATLAPIDREELAGMRILMATLQPTRAIVGVK